MYQCDLINFNQIRGVFAQIKLLHLSTAHIVLESIFDTLYYIIKLLFISLVDQLSPLWIISENRGSMLSLSI